MASSFFINLYARVEPFSISQRLKGLIVDEATKQPLGWVKSHKNPHISGLEYRITNASMHNCELTTGRRMAA